MRSPAAAIAWEFRRRHRWGLITLAGYMIVLAAIKLFIFGPGGRVDFQNDESFALVVVVPLSATFICFLAVFTYGLSGDVGARQSIYPARMFTMPVTSAALAGWPILYGTAAMAMLWFAARALAVWPSDVDVPVFWPALMAASLLAWTQALTWMPYPLPGLRVIVTVLWLAGIDAVVMIALQFKAPEPVMLAILAPHVPIAYLVARFAITRARRGDIPDWRRIFAVAAVPTRRRAHFSSPARAQVWLEWRRRGRSLPAMVAIVLPFELALLFIFKETPGIVFEILAGVLFTPIFMSAFVADSYDLTPFIATRPLTSVSLIAAKLKATVWSTVAAWLLVIVAVPVSLRLSGTLSLVIDWKNNLVEAVGMSRAIVIALLGLTALLLSTWKQLVQSLYIGMSGREWAAKASVFAALSFLSIIFPLGHWILKSKYAMAVLWHMFPWILAALVCLKIAAAVWIAMRLQESQLFSDRILVIGAACWSGIVFALYGLLTWIGPLLLFRHYFLMLVAILTVPLARLSAAPLALAWNRHR